MALISAALGGVLFDMASPALALWPLAFPAIFLILLAQWGRGFWAGAALGAVSGASFWLLHISWLTLYLGVVPWAALSGIMIFWWSLFGGLTAMTTTQLSRVLDGHPGWSGTLLPVAVATLWIARETLAGSWPYGGFAWGRAALTQSESPFASLVSWVGFTGMSAIMVGLVAWFIQSWLSHRGAASYRRAAFQLLPVLTLAVMAIIPPYQLAVTGHTRVAAVQGNSDSGIFSGHSRAQNLNDHYKASLPLVGQNLDLVVWPENASDIDPLRASDAAATLDDLSRRLDAPLVVGAITTENDEYFNSSLVWRVGRGVIGQYDKKHPVPFAEYMPNREFFHLFAPDLVDLVQLEYTPGTRPTTIDISGTRVGLSICFDIVDDSLAQEMVDEGAEFILAQTNNADFGRTDESVQQLAIARLRAVETGRAVVNISTVGTSAMIAPGGHTIESLPAHTVGHMVQDIPRVVGSTPAMIIGSGLTLVLNAIGYIAALVSIVVAIFYRFSRSRTRYSDKESGPPSSAA
ncbi:apolipoprotein N-acyltransferase [Klugiella xanthotipulae]|uniref:Apolipoprotein N-acyltransferase n=1 Tax=Klugiella xanthotipulae TaxID=244735 RepID=A0A543HSV9_9MICO|nr:apolipoprotein N-acyltransferase [Klugiella xanthotipulae]TQM61400.1 apolipoprotein N-acyltransferase [Klugiella xanthotipulae]